MDGEAITYGNIQTLCFLAVGFLNAAFLHCDISRDDFLMEYNGGGMQ